MSDNEKMVWAAAFAAALEQARKDGRILDAVTDYAVYIATAAVVALRNARGAGTGYNSSGAMVKAMRGA
jgi:hypothetical protein